MEVVGSTVPTSWSWKHQRGLAKVHIERPVGPLGPTADIAVCLETRKKRFDMTANKNVPEIPQQSVPEGLEESRSHLHDHISVSAATSYSKLVHKLLPWRCSVVSQLGLSCLFWKSRCCGSFPTQQEGVPAFPTASCGQLYKMMLDSRSLSNGV